MISFEEFYNYVAAKGTKNTVLAFVIWIYINVGVFIIRAVVFDLTWLLDGLDAVGMTAFQIMVQNAAILIDITVFLIMGILIHMNKNWILALIMTCVQGWGMLFTLLAGDGVKGLGLLLLGIYTTNKLRKLKKAYQAYITQWIWPDRYL